MFDTNRKSNIAAVDCCLASGDRTRQTLDLAAVVARALYGFVATRRKKNVAIDHQLMVLQVHSILVCYAFHTLFIHHSQTSETLCRRSASASLYQLTRIARR